MVVRWIHRGCRKNHLWPWMEPQLFYPLHLCVIFVCGWKHEGWSLVLVVKLVKMLYEIISEAQIVRMKSRTRSWTRLAGVRHASRFRHLASGIEFLHGGNFQMIRAKKWVLMTTHHISITFLSVCNKIIWSNFSNIGEIYQIEFSLHCEKIVMKMWSIFFLVQSHNHHIFVTIL